MTQLCSSVFFIALLLLPRAGVLAADGKIRVMSGGPSSVKMLQEKQSEIEAFIGAKLEFLINPVGLAAGALAKDLVEGIITTTDIGETLKAGEEKGMRKQKPEDYIATAFAVSPIRVGLHPANPVQSFTREQMTGIVCGQIQTWSQLGGENKPLIIVIGTSYRGSVESILQTYGSCNTGEQKAKTIFDNDGPGKDRIKQVLDRNGMVNSIKENSGAIGFFTDPAEIPGFKPKYVKTDAAHTSYFITKAKARPQALKLFDYLKSHPLKRD